MACCGSRPSKGTKLPPMGRQTAFVIGEHAVELQRIGRLCSPAFARRTPPFIIEGPGGGATRREKAFLMEGLLGELEHGGWFLKGAVQALWHGERDLVKLQAAVGTQAIRRCWRFPGLF